MDPSSLISLVRRYLGGGEAPEPGVLRRALAGRLADGRKRRGIRHQLAAICDHLAAGTPVGVLLSITGIAEAGSLARYARRVAGVSSSKGVLRARCRAERAP